MPFTSVTATASAKRMHDGVTKAAKVVANTTQVARAAYQRRFSAPGGQVKSPLSGVTIAPPPASAPPRTSQPGPRFTYDHGDAYMSEQVRRGPAYDAMAADVAATAAVDRLEFEVGHSYWDDQVLGAGVEELTTQPCPGCGKTGCGVKLVGSKARGAGGGGALLFGCVECDTERPLNRSAPLDTGNTQGRPVDANTQRVVTAFILGGCGLQTTNAILLALNMTPLCASTWASHAARAAGAAKPRITPRTALRALAAITF